VLRNSWTEFTTLKVVINAVHQLAPASKQASGIAFTETNGNIITDDNKDNNDKTEDKVPIPVMVSDILVAFLLAEINRNLHMLFKCTKADCKAGPNNILKTQLVH